ncbi:Kinesin light chain [Seminavis robusta]|uniref:Kinesin light chain n=1 Tax=Seminavis robusta TaxID=568900 RepID=A0A9N8EG68_9STRA|nr:Kinesin light chain [Seminavis robusta]|eukprot:Sro1077_g238640.1 Kinesin light chain (243) ;mRNA; r:24248-24976
MFMLSYSWSYAFGDILDTLVDFCRSQELDPKRTYVWICCLCVNQHRVVQQSKTEQSGMLAPTVNFFAEFGQRVARIGHLLAMMSPWQNPTYLKRVWCIFELYTSHIEGCEVTVVMPPSEKKALEEDLFGESGNIKVFYDVLSKTKVEDAQASVEKDRIAILEMIKEKPGYHVLNDRLNALLCGWIRRVTVEVIKMRQEAFQNHGNELSYEQLNQLRSGRHDAAHRMLQNMYTLRLQPESGSE